MERNTFCIRFSQSQFGFGPVQLPSLDVLDPSFSFFAMVALACALSKELLKLALNPKPFRHFVGYKFLSPLGAFRRFLCLPFNACFMDKHITIKALPFTFFLSSRYIPVRSQKRAAMRRRWRLASTYPICQLLSGNKFMSCHMKK